MPRRLILALALALSSAALAANTCPDPFPAVSFARFYLLFPLHGQVHTISMKFTYPDPSTNKTEGWTDQITFTPSGRISDYVDTMLGVNTPDVAYHADFLPNGQPHTATLDLYAGRVAQLIWHYPSGHPQGYADMYVLPDNAKAGHLPKTPNYRLVPNVSIENYAVYRKDGSIAATVQYQQATDCSLGLLQVDAPQNSEFTLSALFTGQPLSPDPPILYSFDSVLNQPDMVGMTDTAKPDQGYVFAERRLARDAHGNVTDYVAGPPTHDFNRLALDPGPNTLSIHADYTYYTSTP